MANELQVYIKELGDASWTDITSRVVRANFKIKEGFSSLGGSLNLSKLDITYKASDLAVASIFHTTAKIIRIKKNGAVIWEGFTEGSSTVNSTDSSKLAWVKVSAYPYIHALEKIVAPADEVFYDIFISKQTTDKTSLLERLWSRMIGNAESPYREFLKDSVTIIFPTIEVKRPIVVIEEGDNYLTIFNKILKQYGYVFNLDGFIVRFVQPFADDYREIKQIPFSKIETKPTIKTAPYKSSSRPIITISKIITRDNCQVYSLAQEGENAEHELYINSTFPEEGEYEDIKYSNQNIETDNISFYYAKNPTMSYQARYSDNSSDAVLAEEVKELNGTSAKVKLRNTSTVLSCYLNQLKITAEKAYFLDKTTQVTPTASTIGDKKEETTEWLSTENDANNYINFLLAEQKAETSSFTFKSELLGNEVRPNNLIKIGDIQALYLVRNISTDITTNEKEYSCVLFELQKKTTKVYAMRGLKRVGAKGNKGDRGANGSSNALITLYKRSATEPSSFDGGALTYTFATDTLSGNLGTWSRSISSGSNPLYAITARAYGTGETDIIDIGEWSTPAILSENGTKGENGSTVAVITLYKRGDSAPATPSKTVSFSFHTYTVTNSDGWTLGIPSGSAPCWSIYATAVSSDGVSDTIEPSEWSEPTKAVENGEKGDKGDKGDTGPQGEQGEKGKTGDSITIIKQEVQYQISASGTAVPSGAWEDMPKPKKGYYLWTRVSIYYSDSPNQPRVTYNVSYIAENPQPLLFAWSSSSVVFTPKDSMRVWMYSDKYVQFDSKLLGDFALYNFVEWDEVIKARSDDYPYLWCKYSEDSDPLPVTGKDGKEGLSVYSSVQYHLDVSASLTTSQLEALPSDSWLEEEQCTWEYGRYIYKRLKKTTVETGAVEYTYQGRDTELENHFKSLLSFKISANRLNYPIDKRALETEKTTIKILIEETYYNPDSYSVTINGEAVTPTIANDSFTFDVPLKTGKDLYNIVVIPVKDEANITDVYGELNIVALDITEYDKFYGAVTSLTFSGITLLDGDSCFLTLANGSNEANKIYVYQSNGWVDFNSATLSTDKRMLILSKAQKAALEFANLKGTVAAEYAYIGTLIANYVYAREIGAETITLTGENGKLVGGDYTTEDTDGFLANKGIYLDSTGTAKLNNAKLKNCKINDATLKDATITNLDAENGTFTNMKAVNMEIENGTLTNMKAVNMEINGGSFLFETSNQTLVNPIFKVTHEGNTVFQIDAITGNVFIGKPNSNLTAPETGFMYDAGSQVLVSKDNKLIINADGSISLRGSIVATGSTFNGILTGASGTFTGQFDTPALRSVSNASSGTTISQSIPAGTDYKARYNAFKSFFQKCPNVPIDVSISGHSEKFYFTKYNYGYAVYYANGTHLSYVDINNVGSSRQSYTGGGITTAFTISAIYGAGDILILKDVQTGSAGLQSGQVYKTSDNHLMIVP